MPKNVMKLLKRSPHQSRNAFDLSHRHLMTANFGELLPVTCIETVPGDSIELHVSDLLRAIPMVTSPFMRVKQHFDVFFTPYEDLWQNFEPFMVQRTEPKHANNYMGYQYLPHENLLTLTSALTSHSSETDVVGRPYLEGARKLFDYLGYGRMDSSGTIDDNPSVNLFRIAQYNKIWYDEYRQNYYDEGIRFLTEDYFTNGKVNPSVIFNFDDLLCDSETNSRIAFGSKILNASDDEAGSVRLAEMFQMRYRCWKKDLFTGLMPSTQFGDVSVVELSHLSGLNSFLIRGYNADGTAAVGNAVFSDSGYLGHDSDVTENTFSANKFLLRDASDTRNITLLTRHADGSRPHFDVLALRKSEAIQLWRERALTAGNRIGDNLRSHYGDEVDYNDHRSTFLGSIDAPLNISDINATAETGADTNGSLGDVAGKGMSSLDKKVFKFKAKKFGCIMVIFSLLPETEYESYGIDRMNCLLESEDFFVPEYENLGLEAVSSQNFYKTLTSVSRVIGYAPRYYAYKQKLDKAFGQFRNGGYFAQWASPKTDVTQTLASGSTAMPLSLLYVNPALYDRNFAVSVDNSEQVICDFYFDVSCVRPMSVSGLPNY